MYQLIKLKKIISLLIILWNFILKLIRQRYKQYITNFDSVCISDVWLVACDICANGSHSMSYLAY